MPRAIRSMYETDKLVFVQMQKTGSTHIATLLSAITNGPQPNEGEGKHFKATADQIASGKTIISSIRNPWDWYVSLWTFGCNGKGGLWNRLVSNSKSEGPLDKEKWREVYANKADTGLFREWLCMLFNPINKPLIEHDPNGKCETHQWGFMTHRYTRLCWRDKPPIITSNQAQARAEPTDIDDTRCYIDHFIRLESLEEDFIRVIGGIHDLNREQKSLILRARPTNASHRVYPIHKYYDRSTTSLVKEGDKLIAYKFGYEEPNI